MDKYHINVLYQSLGSYSLDERIKSLVNPATLEVDSLRFLGRLMESLKPVHVFEFGSGISTEFFSNQLNYNPSGHLYSVDHAAKYHEKTREAITGHRNVSLFLCPISLYQFSLKGFASYSNKYLRHIPSPMRFDLVLIDGPPGYRYGREATLYQIAPFITNDTIIVLDDANREPEQEAIANWKRVFTGGMEVLHFPRLKKGIALIQIKDPSRKSIFPFSPLEIWTSWKKALHVMMTEKGLTHED